MHHVGTDNLLYAQCDKLGEEYHSEKAIIAHYHWSKGDKVSFDFVAEKGWSKVEEDRKILKEELALL